MCLSADAAEVYGTGLPYALENQPQRGDDWGWRTRRRVFPNDKHFQDQYLYFLDRLFWLLKEENQIPRSGSDSKMFHKQHIFASKSAVKSYINTYFPGTDHEDFLSSFSQRIPTLLVCGNIVPIVIISIRQITHEPCDSNYENFVVCKENNEECSSLVFVVVPSCDVCCS